MLENLKRKAKYLYTKKWRKKKSILNPKVLGRKRKRTFNTQIEPVPFRKPSIKIEDSIPVLDVYSPEEKEITVKEEEIEIDNQLEILKKQISQNPKINVSPPISIRLRYSCKRSYNRKSKEKIKRWTNEESLRYEQFVFQHQGILKSATIKRSAKVFILMSKFIDTKDPSQCRSHHQKFFLKTIEKCRALGGSEFANLATNQASLLGDSDDGVKIEFNPIVENYGESISIHSVVEIESETNPNLMIPDFTEYELKNFHNHFLENLCNFQQPNFLQPSANCFPPNFGVELGLANGNFNANNEGFDFSNMNFNFNMMPQIPMNLNFPLLPEIQNFQEFLNSNPVPQLPNFNNFSFPDPSFYNTLQQNFPDDMNLNFQ